MFYGRFFGIGSSSAKTDRGNQLGGVNADWSVFNRGLPLADTQTKAGQATTATGLQTMATGVSGLDAAKKYYSDIMSGGPAAMKAAQPAVSAVNTQADAARTEQANMGTARGGGVNAHNQEAETNRMAQDSNIIAGQAPVAAQGIQSVSSTEGAIGNAQTSAGSQQLQQALESLGLDSSVASEIINSSMQSRDLSLQANPLTGAGSSIVTSVLDKALTKMGF